MSSDFDKPFAKMSDDEKLAYSRYIQGKYIKDFNKYLIELNNGRISLQKMQIKEWVEALRKYRAQTLKAGWKDFIQTLRPNYLPSIIEAREHFKKYTVLYKKPEIDDDSVDKDDFKKMITLCMDYRVDGPILFHQKCIVFWQELADKETNADLRYEHLKSAKKHKQMLQNLKPTNNNNHKLRIRSRSGIQKSPERKM